MNVASNEDVAWSLSCREVLADTSSRSTRWRPARTVDTVQWRAEAPRQKAVSSMSPEPQTESDESDAGDRADADDRYNTDIDLEDEDDIEEWCRSFACSSEELRAAVRVMGHSAKKVRVYLRDRQQAAE